MRDRALFGMTTAPERTAVELMVCNGGHKSKSARSTVSDAIRFVVDNERPNPGYNPADPPGGRTVDGQVP